MDLSIKNHPILEINNAEQIRFCFRDQPMIGYNGDTIASALHRNGVKVLTKSNLGKPRGFFCANGQCNSCLVNVNGNPNIRSCMEPLKEGMVIQPEESFGKLPEVDEVLTLENSGPEKISDSVLNKEVVVIGGGPAGLEASICAAKYGCKVLLIDDRNILGGKLLFQTHKFFGSSEHSAGMRGFEIAKKLSEKAVQSGVELMFNTNVIGIFDDGTIGCITRSEGKEKYSMLMPKYTIIATGAREKMISFPGSDLPGVYGAGAVQTLMNRDLVLPGKRVLMVGAGNVGLIVSYQLIQAGAEIVGVVEGAPRDNIRGWDVHYRKLKRLGVPFYFNHVVKAAIGKECVEKAIISKAENFRAIAGEEKAILCDTICLGVGLSPVDEFKIMSKSTSVPFITVGDADSIDEATVAMTEGRIAGIIAAEKLKGIICSEKEKTKALLDSIRQFDVTRHNQIWKINQDRQRTIQMLKNSKTAKAIIECTEEIPCDPCVESCRLGKIRTDNLISIPKLDEDGCIGCGECIAKCSGLAIRVIHYQQSWIMIPYEMHPLPKKEDIVRVTGNNGEFICNGKILEVRLKPNKTNILKIEVPRDLLLDCYGISFQKDCKTITPSIDIPDEMETIICRCEDIKKRDIIDAVKMGCTTVSEVKRFTRAGMGTCQGKTCRELVARIIEETLSEIKKEKIRLNDEDKRITPRAPQIPVQMKAFAEAKYV